jgi:type 1 glutamine amidotransferase
VKDLLLYVTEVAPYAESERRPDAQRRLAGAHHVLPQSIACIRQFANLAGLRFAHFDSVSLITTEQLEQTRVLALFTIGETPWSEVQKQIISDRIRSGEIGFLPMHAASDACYTWPEYGRLVGARFAGHPWTQEFTVEVIDGSHPATRHLGTRWRLTDEVYLFRELRADCRVLLRALASDLDMSATGARVPETGIPLAWCFREGRGRVFYTALGHFPALYENPTFLGHVFGGLQWILSQEADQ